MIERKVECMDEIQQYLNDTITIEELIHTFDKRNHDKTEIKKGGIVYTPKYISDYIVQLVDPELNETIFEPSVGHGIFVISILEYVQKKYSFSGKELKHYVLEKIFAQDIREQTINELKVILVAFFAKLGVDVDAEEFDNFSFGDTLVTGHINYDIVVGNPPYVRVKNIDTDYLKWIRQNFSFCSRGNIDLYYAFMEFALMKANRGSFIVPNSWLYNVSAAKLRDSMKNHIRTVIDFKHKTVFSGADTYTSIFLFDKSLRTTKSVVYKETIEGDGVDYELDMLTKNPWSFGSKDVTTIQLETVKFHTPIATLRDKIYITDGAPEQDCAGYYKLSKIKNEQGFVDGRQTIIFPYKLSDGKYTIKSENELDSTTLQYMTDQVDELNQRDKGKTTTYDAWYAYGRRQGLNLYSENNEIVIIPGMISSGFRFFSVSLSKIKQPFVFTSGFVLEIEPRERDMLLNFLNSIEFNKFMKEHGKVWKGTDSNFYHSLSMRQLKSVIEKSNMTERYNKFFC